MKRIHPSAIGFVLFLSILTLGCKDNKKDNELDQKTKTVQVDETLEKTPYGELPDGRKVERYTLRNKAGMEIDVITYGGIITRWTAPDKNGDYGNVVLGFDNLAQYLEGNPYFGALIGRYGNRIAKGNFELDDTTYSLATNDGDNHLHGGEKGFDKVLWQAQGMKTAEGPALVLSYTSKDGEEGYPGTLKVEVTYTLTEDNALDIHYRANTDKPTIVNLTQHSYFNLSGDFGHNILDHELSLVADRYIPVDSGLIPTGELRPVAGTPFDFTQAKAIGQDIDGEDGQLKLGQGYDHCWVLDKGAGSFSLAASAYHSGTGRFLEVFTEEPGIQFYSGNFLDGSLPSPQGGTYGRRAGFCLETQHFPDSPNQGDFPSVRLDPGETYTTRTLYRLTTK